MTAASDASAWSRSGSASGWRGTASVGASGSCAGGSCSRSISRTGPYGYSTSRQGSASCAGGTCSGSRTTTGPAGNTATRQGTVSRY
nr:hypothetical protein [Bosea vaviloviae]